jgi:poly-gamma-glutamate capsule biosynthesis protein CapA/YwtB (metallophosphatase superfamily)
MLLLASFLLAAAPAPDASVPSAPLLRLRAVGDMMLGTSVPEGKLPPDRGDHLLEAVAPLLRDADVTFANLEGPLCDSGTSNKCRPKSNCFAFRMPTAYGAHLADAGVDVVSTANNHAGDFGEACRRETEATLDALHLAWSGPPGTVARLTVGGRKLALVAFHTSDSTNDVNDLPRAKALVSQLAREVDLVIVSFHGGKEGLDATHVADGPEPYLGENRGDLKRFAHGVIDAGAALVLGHGPHVLRAMEVYRGHLIAYSLGNFATYGRFDLTGLLGVAVVLEAQLDEQGRFVEGRLFPVKQLGLGVPVPDEAGQGVEQVRSLSRTDFPASGVVVGPDGRLTPR